MKEAQITRKFKDYSFYQPDQVSTYYLLPFTFHRLNNGKEILVNEVGDFLVVPNGTAHRIATKQVLSTEELFKDLISAFFISTSPIPELIDVQAARYRTKKSFLDSFTSLHIFVVTLRCNHSCHYCQVSRVTTNRQDYDMSVEDMDRAIDLMFSSPAPSLTMEFQGGEPLLAFEMVQYGVEKALEKNLVFKKQLSFVICTNLTILSNDILSFCRAHNIILSSSLDGPDFLHNANRSKTGATSYELVIDGIKQAREALGHDRVSVLMTTTVKSLDHPIDIINTYIENEFSSIFLRPISPFGFAVKNHKKNQYHTEKFLSFYKIAFDYILEINRSGHHFSEDYATVILKKILTPFSTGYVDLQSPAGLVINVVVYNYDGYVYASDESRMLAENGDFTFRLGHVSDSYKTLFYGPLAKKIIGHSLNENMAGCSDCGFRVYCGTDPVQHYATQGDLEGNKATSIFCQKNMGIIEYLFERITSDKSDYQIFQSWVSRKNHV